MNLEIYQRETNILNKKRRKKTNFDFHLDKIKELDRDWLALKTIPNFPYENSKYYYTRNDESGWWMAIKQIAIRSYINTYLTILGKKKRYEIIFYRYDEQLWIESGYKKSRSR